MALLEAQSAVQMDNEGNISGAIESYSKAVALLSKVVNATTVPEERERLKIIRSESTSAVNEPGYGQGQAQVPGHGHGHGHGHGQEGAGGSGAGRGRYRTKTHTGVSTLRVAESGLLSPEEESSGHLQYQPRRTGHARGREREALPKVVILQSAPTTPLPLPPPPRPNGLTSEPMPLTGVSMLDSIAEFVPAPTSSFTTDFSTMPPIPESVMAPVQPLKPNRLRAASPPSRPPRPNSPTLSASHMIMQSLMSSERPLSPPPSAPLPYLPSKPASPPLPPSGPTRRMKGVVQAGGQVKQMDIHDLIPSRDQSLQPQREKGPQEENEDEEEVKDEQGQQQSAGQTEEDKDEHDQGSNEETKEAEAEAEAEEEQSLTGELSHIQELSFSSEAFLEEETFPELTAEEAEELADGGPDELVQEWLPNLLNKSFATSKIFLEHLERTQEAAPRERVFIKGWYNPSQPEQEEESIPPMLPIRTSLSSFFTNDDDRQTIHIMLDSSVIELQQQQQQQEEQEQERELEREQLMQQQQQQQQQRQYEQLMQQQYQEPERKLAQSVSPHSHYQAAASSISLTSSSSGSSSSGRSRVSISMPLFGTDSKKRNSGSLPRRSGESPSLSPVSPTEHRANMALMSNAIAGADGSWKELSDKKQPKHNNNSSTNTREWTLQDVIAHDPFAGMKPPLPHPEISPAPTSPFLRCFWFIHLLEQTMTTGGFLSPKLYVPRHIWYQKAMIRLPAIEAKINTCNALSQFLDRMATQSKNGELNLFVGMDRRLEKAENERNLVLKELEAFEAITLDHWNKLGKKLSFIQRPGKVSDQAGASHSRNSSTSFSGPGYGGQGHAPSPYHQHRPPHHYQQKHGEHDDNGSNPYDWLQSDDPISATLVSGSMSSVALSTGTLSSGTFSTGLMTSSNLTSSSMSDKGGPTTGNTRRSTADLKNQWKNFSKTVQKTIVNEKM
ncbi:hypothetical protein BGZ54_010061 [Gamsiella multidivaricata]|nr:hypothetical protein BGZ54_010061 [Gamsiella multidivaricata]